MENASFPGGFRSDPKRSVGERREKAECPNRDLNPGREIESLESLAGLDDWGCIIQERFPVLIALDLRNPWIFSFIQRTAAAMIEIFRMSFIAT